MGDDQVHKAAILGSPVGHSRSPQLHLAAYQALGLSHWTYDRIECTAEQLPGLVTGFGPEWAGLSVTMPAKAAALAFADEQTSRAATVGSANTLIHLADGGWRADCTDIDGVVGALTNAGHAGLQGHPVVVLGAGGTARPALYALRQLGAGSVTIVARDRNRAAPAMELAAALDLSVQVAGFAADEVRGACADAAVVVNTVPAAVAADIADEVALAPLVLDVIYDPWPTPLARTVIAAGRTAVGGLDMLLYQAFGQVEQFTGRPAPRAAMAAALAA